MQKYTSFQMHEHDEVRQILTMDQQIFALYPNSLRCNAKMGRPQFRYEYVSFQWLIFYILL